MPNSGTNTNRKIGRALKKFLLILLLKNKNLSVGRTEDLNLSTVSAQTVLFSRLFQSTIVHVEKLYLKMAALVVSTAFSNLHLDSFVSRFKKKCFVCC